MSECRHRGVCPRPADLICERCGSVAWSCNRKHPQDAHNRPLSAEQAGDDQ